MIRKILTTYAARLDEYLARSHRQPEGVAEVGLIGSAGEQCPNKLVVSLVNLEREASGDGGYMQRAATGYAGRRQPLLLNMHIMMAAVYVLILFVIFGIVYIWLNEQNRQQELEATTYKIRSLRKDVHEVYMKVVDLSMIGETDGSYIIKYVHFFGGYMEEISYLCYVNNNTESNGDKL